MAKSKARNSAPKPAFQKRARRATRPATQLLSQSACHNGVSSGAAPPAFLQPNGAPASVDIAEKVKELVRLAHEQGYLTYNDVSDALRDKVISPEELDAIYVKLRNLEIAIVDQAEVDRVQQPEPDAEDEKARLDILDDPVRMYFKQMGQVPLLTREQKVRISKRIEDAGNTS